MNIHHARARFPQRTRQRGAVLLVALIFLILLTLLAIGASSGSLLQQRMVSATRSAQLATMSADTALRGAEWRLWSNPGLCQNETDTIDPNTGCVRYEPGSAAYAPNGAVTQFRAANNEWLNTGVAYTGLPSSHDFTNNPLPDDHTASPNVAENPRYIIEDLGPVTQGQQQQGGFNGPNNKLPGALHLNVYRITARATGGTQNIVRVAQSTFDAQSTK